MLAPSPGSVAGPMQPNSQFENGTAPNARVLDRLPNIPPELLKKKGKKPLMSAFSGADAGGPESGPDDDLKDMQTLHQLAKSNPMLGAVASIASIEKRIPLLARFAPQTAQMIIEMIRQGAASEILNQGQPPINPLAGGPSGPMPTPPAGMPPGGGMPGGGIPTLPAAAPPGIGIGQ